MHQHSAAPFGGQRVLVTGAAGFIGGRLCERLRAGGAEVHALSRNHRSSADGVNEWHVGDLADPDCARALLRAVAPDTVFHLASRVSGQPGHDLVRPMIEDNLLATVNLLTAVQDVGCRRMVVTGTLSEGSSEAASSPYAAAKSAATEYTRMFHSLYGTPVVCLRLSMVYGPGQPDASKLVPHVVESLLEGEPPCVSSGRFETDWIYIDDVVDALLRAAVAQGVEGQALDVGSGHKASVREVVELLAATIDPDLEPRFGDAEARPRERSASPDLGRTRELLSWSPATSLAAGLKRTVEWYRGRLPSMLVVLALGSEAAAG